MTDTDFVTLQTQVAQLQKQADDQRNNWRKIWKASVVMTLFLLVLAAGFLVTAAMLDSKAFPTTHLFVQVMGSAILFTTAPLTLLSQALRSA